MINFLLFILIGLAVDLGSWTIAYWTLVCLIPAYKIIYYFGRIIQAGKDTKEEK